MALTHRLFGIRSCNEVITGKRGAAVPGIRHQALPGAVRDDDLHGGAVHGRRSTTRGCSSRAGTRSSSSSCTARMVGGRRSDERFEEAAQLRDAMRTVQTLRERHQKMATAELGDRDVFGVKVGPAAPSCRCSSCAAGASSSASSS